MNKRKVKRFLYRYILSYVGLVIVKAISLTYRVRICCPKNEEDTLEKHNSIIYASWHQRFFPGISFFSSRKPISIMISQSRDGDFVSNIVSLLGWVPVRGSSTRGGEEALAELKELSLKWYKIGHIEDGPKGPFGENKHG